VIGDKAVFIKENLKEYGINAIKDILCMSKSRIYEIFKADNKIEKCKVRNANDKEIIDALNKLWEIEAGTFRAGYKKLSRYLKQYFSIIINHKRLYRIMKSNRMLRRMKKDFKSVKISKNVYSYSSNKLWGTDMTYIPTDKGFVYMFATIDHYDRSIVGYHISDNCKAVNAVIALNKAINNRLCDTSSLELRSDNGSQYCSKLFKETIALNKIYHTRSMVNTPKNNSRIERFFKTIKYEFLNDYRFRDIEDVKLYVDYFCEFYNEKRIHQSLKYENPADFKEENIA